MAKIAIMDKVVLFARMFEGAHMAFSGLDYYFPFVPAAHPNIGLQGQYIDIIQKMGLYNTVKVCEAIAGIALMLNLLVPTFLIMAFVIDLNVFYFSTVFGLFLLHMHLVHPVITSCRDLLVDSFLFAAYARYYLPITNLRAKPDGLWSIIKIGGVKAALDLREPRHDYTAEDAL